MKALTWIWLVPLLLMAAAPARASDQSDQLVALLHDRQWLEQAKAHCEDRYKRVTPEAYFKRDPNAFYGLDPQSKQWPEAVSIYRAYAKQLCAYFAPADYIHAISAQYAKELSPQDLQAAIRFYSSPLGRRLVKAHLAAATRLLNLEYANYSAAYRQAAATYRRKMKDLARQAGALPH